MTHPDTEGATLCEDSVGLRRMNEEYGVFLDDPEGDWVLAEPALARIATLAARIATLEAENAELRKRLTGALLDSGTAVGEARRLRASLQQAEEDRDMAQANYQFMVDRAADEKLDGYRELGARAANGENGRDKALAELAEMREERDRLKEECQRMAAELGEAGYQRNETLARLRSQEEQGEVLWFGLDGDEWFNYGTEKPSDPWHAHVRRARFSFLPPGETEP